jgi:hypothetical protein
MYNNETLDEKLINHRIPNISNKIKYTRQYSPLSITSDFVL